MFNCQLVLRPWSELRLCNLTCKKTHTQSVSWVSQTLAPCLFTSKPEWESERASECVSVSVSVCVSVCVPTWPSASLVNQSCVIIVHHSCLCCMKILSTKMYCVFWWWWWYCGWCCCTFEFVFLKAKGYFQIACTDINFYIIYFCFNICFLFLGKHCLFTPVSENIDCIYKYIYHSSLFEFGFWYDN